MKRLELLQQVRSLLIKAGFYCSRVCNIRPSSFDFVARKDNLLLIVKVLNNIDALNEDVANELLSVAKFLEGVPIVIGNRTCSSYLKEDVVYFRYGVPIITPSTLENYLQGMAPVVSAAPGGFYVNIDGEKLRRLRVARGISLGQLARIAGVSRRMIRMYEQGERASIEVVEKITKLLGYDFIKPIDFMEKIEAISIERKVEDEILRILEEIGAFIYQTHRCPFHAITEIVDEKVIVGIKEKRIYEKAKLISSLSKVAEKHSVILMDSSPKKNIEGIPVIEKRELKRMTGIEEVIELIRERE